MALEAKFESLIFEKGAKVRKSHDYRQLSGFLCAQCGKPIKQRLIEIKKKRPHLCYQCYRKAKNRGSRAPKIIQAGLLLLIILTFAAGCRLPSPALERICITQAVVLKEYVEVASEAILKDPDILPEHKEDWGRVGQKLIRNQEMINKLVGVRK